MTFCPLLGYKRLDSDVKYELSFCLTSSQEKLNKYKEAYRRHLQLYRIITQHNINLFTFNTALFYTHALTHTHTSNFPVLLKQESHHPIMQTVTEKRPQGQTWQAILSRFYHLDHHHPNLKFYCIKILKIQIFSNATQMKKM